MLFSKGRVFASKKTLRNVDVAMWPHTIAVDTREQFAWTMQGIETSDPPPKPFKFDDFKMIQDEIKVPLVIPTQTVSMPTGDYSIVGHENEISIERKSIQDLFGTLGKGRDRFEDELGRLNAMRGFVVVEASWAAVMSGLAESQLNPQSVYGSVIAYQQRFPKVHWWFCQHRRDAETTTFRILRYFAEGIANT